jgi:hypothetical protein
MLNTFTVSCYRFTLSPREAIRLPRVNKGITLRGAFGTAFRSLVCADRRAHCDQCLLHSTCPYGFVFAPQVPANAERLRLNRDIPRPFVIKPPLDGKVLYRPGENLAFDLMLVGKAGDFLPYFLVSFRELGERGIGVGRGRYEIEQVEAIGHNGASQLIYHRSDPVVRTADLPIRWDGPLGRSEIPPKVRVRFLTPVLLKQGGQWVKPCFGALMKRLRDRIQALSYFYCGETLDMDFQRFGEAADRVASFFHELRWVEEHRRSRQRDIKHSLKGYVGTVSYEGDLEPFWPFLRMGEYLHVGKAAVFGQGWYRIED